ncbi:MAG: transposase [Bacteriovorax sp.]|nr:transposase [Bacteriovorax sp.]
MNKKKIRKNTQLNFINPKSAGRPSTTDVGIRHISRARIVIPTSLHLTIKVQEIAADIKTKRILKVLHHAIKRARLKKLKIIHYTLEHNHVHLLVEARDNQILHQGMQAFGITFAKAINKLKHLKGVVYKHRYHFRKVNSPHELKSVLHYIFRNGIKHKRTMSMIDPYNSFVAEQLISADMEKIILKSEFLVNLRGNLRELLDLREVHFLKKANLWS